MTWWYWNESSRSGGAAANALGMATWNPARPIYPASGLTGQRRFGALAARSLGVLRHPRS